MSYFYLYLLLGLGIGAISGVLGIGGGVLLIPILMLCGYDQRHATGTTLAVLVPPVGLLAAWEYFRRNEANIPAAIWIALGFVVGGFFGARLVGIMHAEQQVSQAGLKVAFGLLLIYIGVYYIAGSSGSVFAALTGLVAVGLSWFTYVWLKALGKKYRPKNLAEEIGRRYGQPPPEGPEYYI